MTRSKSLIALVVIVFSAVAAVAQLSPAMSEWGKGPVQHLMSRDEQRQWRSVRNDADAQKFIDLFWARRDPTPATPENEFKGRFDALVKFADENYTYHKTPGSMTDRGKITILLGVPSRVARTGGVGTPVSGAPPAPDLEGTGPTQVLDDYPVETWTYEKDRIPPFLGPLPAVVVFDDQRGGGDWRLGRSIQTNVTDAMKKAVEAAIISPKLTVAPHAASAQAQVVETQVPASEIKIATQIESESLRTAAEQVRTAPKNPYKEAHLTYGEFITSAGEYFVPVQIYLPKSAGFTADTMLTFFGTVTDEAGSAVAAWEEPAKLVANKEDVYFDKTLELSPGKYVAVFGLAKEGAPLVASRVEMKLEPLEKDSAGISRLLVSNNIYPLEQAQQARDPFAFGGIKVVPKGDQTFTKEDELWYFLELRNPGLDAAGQPKIQVKLDLEGTAAGGRPVKMSAPLQEVPTQELKGVPGHFALGSSIPLSSFSAGDYTLKVKVIDTLGKQTYDLAQKFRIANQGS
ncbi:MAG TPA: GWxTD domain-containing protein [Thermoanaerobaculia bacterium]|nr:GWxTD domain-containing protein [Thermoanaerobaculia bacterium]